MKKTSNIKTRIIAGLLSTITAFSVGAIAISSASAAETNSSEYILQQNNANEPMSYATVKAEDSKPCSMRTSKATIRSQR